MCELLGISSEKPYIANDLLDSFFSHGRDCRDGWGLAVFRGENVTVEKEPVRATRSTYLKHRLSSEIKARNLFAHIRKATLGRIEYVNCHPFVREDDSGRMWTLVHNGTLFEGKYTSLFLDLQEGSTDSERILLYLTEQVNGFVRKNGCPPDEEERFRIVDKLTVRLSAGNKLNLLIFDGTAMYVHSNCPDSLYIWQDNEKCLFATVPVRFGGWEKVPMNQLLVYQNGRLIREGTRHSHVFHDEDHDFDTLYSAFAEL